MFFSNLHLFNINFLYKIRILANQLVTFDYDNSNTCLEKVRFYYSVL